MLTDEQRQAEFTDLDWDKASLSAECAKAIIGFCDRHALTGLLDTHDERAWDGGAQRIADALTREGVVEIDPRYRISELREISQAIVPQGQALHMVCPDVRSFLRYLDRKGLEWEFDPKCLIPEFNPLQEIEEPMRVVDGEEIFWADEQYMALREQEKLKKKQWLRRRQIKTLIWSVILHWWRHSQVADEESPSSVSGTPEQKAIRRGSVERGRLGQEAQPEHEDAPNETTGNSEQLSRSTDGSQEARSGQEAPPEYGEASRNAEQTTESAAPPIKERPIRSGQKFFPEHVAFIQAIGRSDTAANIAERFHKHFRFTVSTRTVRKYRNLEEA